MKPKLPAAGDEVALLIYRSNLLGYLTPITEVVATSCRVLSKESTFTGNEVDQSSGSWNAKEKWIGTALYVDRLRKLTNVYRGIGHEDEVVEL